MHDRGWGNSNAYLYLEQVKGREDDGDGWKSNESMECAGVQTMPEVELSC